MYKVFLLYILLVFSLNANDINKGENEHNLEDNYTKDSQMIIDFLVKLSNNFEGEHIDDIIRFEGAKAGKKYIEFTYMFISKDDNNSKIIDQFHGLEMIAQLDDELEKEVKKSFNEIKNILKKDITHQLCRSKLFKALEDKNIHYKNIYYLFDNTKLFSFDIYPSYCKKTDKL